MRLGGSHTTGGYLKDIPLPHVRKFPTCGEPRELTIRIMRYYGVGVHYYVTAWEEDNPIIIGDPSEYRYQSAWDDEEGKGRTWSLGRFAKYSLAERSAEKFARRKEFREGYAITIDDSQDIKGPRQYIYKEGD